MNELYKSLNNIHTKSPASIPLTDEETDQYFSKFQKSIQPQKKKKQKKYSIALAAALLLSPVALLSEDVQGAAGKLLNDLHYSMSDFISPAAKTYATHINETISAGDIDYKLTDIYADSRYLTYHLLIDLPDDADLNQSHTNLKSLRVNGHAVMQGSFGSSQVIDEKKKIISETQTIVMTDDLTDKTQNIELTFNDSQNNNNAVYQFTSDNNKLTKDTQKIKLNHVVKIGQHDIKIDQLMINPLMARINLSYPETSDVFDIKAVDEKGKEYSFDTNTVETKNESKAMLSFNPDFSTGKIVDLKNAKSLKLNFEGRNGEKNGSVEISSKNEKPIEIKLK